MDGLGHITESIGHDTAGSRAAREVVPRMARFVAWATGKPCVLVEPPSEEVQGS